MSILLKNVIIEGKKRDLFIEGKIIKNIGDNLDLKAEEEIDAKGEKAVLPGFVNCHTHAAMSLLRGYGDDLSLKEWLENKIWPLEAKLTPDDIYWGTKLACLEMIKTGTLAFNDMYFFPESAISATEEMGLRALIGLVVFDLSESGQPENIEKTYYRLQSKKSDLINLSVAPHSIYTVSKENLIWSKNFAQKENLILHIHLSETEKEVDDCLKENNLRPAEYLNQINFLGENVILAHSVWLSEGEISIIAENKSSPVYNPCSNLKLVSGEIFPYKAFKDKNVNICLGTDGAASNNSLDMIREAKFASLLQKHKEKDPTFLPADEALSVATKSGYRALRMGSGEIKEGNLADLILVDLNKTYFAPGLNFVSDLIYAASGDCVSDSICNGRILMRDKKVEGEDEIIKKSKKIAEGLVRGQINKN
ncbi:MAG: amidohydrolase [Candidatus Nealsonbacteria bacterium]|nr:amidohydrolase [Candidatus Nealsonbacteria bacterium]